MILDGHIHLMEKSEDVATLKQTLQKANIDGGMLISLPPNSFSGENMTWQERIANLQLFIEGEALLFPCFWIDPTEPDALIQVSAACEAGVDAFKVICDHFYPKEGLEVYRAIAQKGKPILFHSGVLWNGQPSAQYNRPAEFECLLQVKGLKFTLAHVSWPWCDENLAVYGKFLNAFTFNKDLSVEMFIDITPGTPAIYREEVLRKIHTIGYDVADNVIFGTDCFGPDYNGKWANDWMERDNAIYEMLELEEKTIKKIYGENLLRFLGKTAVKIERKIPVPDGDR